MGSLIEIFLAIALLFRIVLFVGLEATIDRARHILADLNHRSPEKRGIVIKAVPSLKAIDKRDVVALPIEFVFGGEIVDMVVSKEHCRGAS